MSQNIQEADQKNDHSLSQSLGLKAKYLKQLKDALAKHDDLLVYKLLNTTKYYHVMKKERYSKNGDYTALIKDLQPELSHHLSRQLIKYLKKNYPFFYYHENKLGHYQIYFGDWWGHKLFGSLDVINVEFNFSATEYNKLRQSFSDQAVNTQRLRAIQQQDNKLSKLIRTQNQRDNQEVELKSDLKANKAQARMPWNSNRLTTTYSKITNKLKKLTKQDQEANNAKNRIQSNQQRMLEVSKESTVISYEKQCIKKYFGDLSQFNQSNKQLYYNYVSSLMSGGKD